MDQEQAVEVLTPRTVVDVIVVGYVPGVHGSVVAGIAQLSSHRKYLCSLASFRSFALANRYLSLGQKAVVIRAVAFRTLRRHLELRPSLACFSSIGGFVAVAIPSRQEYRA